MHLFSQQRGALRYEPALGAHLPDGDLPTARVAGTAQICGIGRILGARERDLPPTWPEFERYYRAMIAGFGPNETISTLFETIETVRKPFSSMSNLRWSKLDRQLFLIRTRDVPLRPASAAPPSSGGSYVVCQAAAGAGSVAQRTSQRRRARQILPSGRLRS
ncbi:oxygenase MpaB family protein [Amycolatopsis sp. VS8301801F10]|uniref:oxygenase MpaB family protein n=1 Tax=Amycolatopsis sp. VS8301801F10 TaxID=2652442 RepID=UPI0038FCB33A